MKRILFLFFFIIVQQYLSAQITDNFTDGDFTSSPTWILATSTDFTVSSGQLKSANTTTNSNFYIITFT